MGLLENPGQKLKSVTYVFFIIGIVFIVIAAILGFAIVSSFSTGGLGILVIFAAVILFLVMWIQSLFISAYADMAAQLKRQTEILERIESRLAENKAAGGNPNIHGNAAATRNDAESFQTEGSSDELIAAASDNDIERVKALLAAGADSGIQDEKGRTALMQAAYNGHVEVIKALLEKGANPDIQDKAGSTALILAAYKNNTEAVRLLLEAGANPSIRDNNGDTALIWANYNHNEEMANMLKGKM